MRDELSQIITAIDAVSLPSEITDIVGPIWDAARRRFHAQETYLLDYKEELPGKLGEGYGAGIIRLCLGFHNTFGGIIIFGVRDSDFSVKGIDSDIDVEAINRALTDFSGFRGECQAKSYVMGIGEEQRVIGLLLVSKRKNCPPVRLTKPLGKYPVGTLWVRDRAEVMEIKPRHFSLVYSSRENLQSDDRNARIVPIHRSLPPSPATMKTFVGRESLLIQLWDWMIFGDQPRLYLHGPGGSGKSTLAFEFARLLTETDQQIKFPQGENLDYVIYISGKETELDPLTGRESSFKLQQFRDSEEQFAQILFHSGLLDEKLIATAKEEKLFELLDELFSNYSGLIVVDDIDALHRRNMESGEETLLMKAFRNKGRTRILYTLRFPPANAARTSTPVPGLEGDEFYDFMETCCTQFQVKAPDGQYLPLIMEATKSLPLLIETVVGLRKSCGSYQDALATFTARGGDDARRYLYQREYDRLDRNGKARQVLAALVLVEDNIRFSTMSRLFQFPPEQLRDAISELNSVFLTSTDDAENGETLYQLTPPCIPFVRRTSRELPYYSKLEKSVSHFRNQTVNVSSAEASLIVALDRLIRLKRYHEISRIEDGLPKDDPVLVNPKIRSLLGQAHSELGPLHREKAREWFRAAEGLNYYDVFMMRRWYYLEVGSGHGLNKAEEICSQMLSDAELSPRVRNEFTNKLAVCLLLQAIAVGHINKERMGSLLRRSIAQFFEAFWVAQRYQDAYSASAAGQFDKSLTKYFQLANEDVDLPFLVMDDLLDRKHDIAIEPLSSFFYYLDGLSSRLSRNDAKSRFKGQCSRVIKKLSSVGKARSEEAGLKLLSNLLDRLRDKQISKAVD